MRKVRADLRVQAAPLKAAVRESALAKLPKRGGLNEQVANQRVTVSTLAGVRTAGVRLRTTAPDTAMTDSGFVRHPTFGKRGKGEWETQSIPEAAGWWSDTLASKGPEITTAMRATLEAVAVEIAGEI